MYKNCLLFSCYVTVETVIYEFLGPGLENECQKNDKLCDKYKFINASRRILKSCALVIYLSLFLLCRRFELERPGVGPCSRGADLGKGGNKFWFCKALSLLHKDANVIWTLY